MNDDYHYVGDELELFSHAKHWKSYWGKLIRPYLRGSVLEIGAGIGNNTRNLWHNSCSKWTCLEPDSSLVLQLRKLQTSNNFSAKNIEIQHGNIRSLKPEEKFNTLLYIDVLEHIEDDKGELEKASEHTYPGGIIIILGPAHPFLYSAFDHNIGHIRRYNEHMLFSLIPPSCHWEVSQYLDVVGMLASLANKFFLHKKIPTRSDILFWDRVMIPISRVLDPIIKYRLGKSHLLVLRKKRVTE